MGQDGEDWQGGDAGVSGASCNGPPRSFAEEIREAVRYEQGLFVKAMLALALVALVALLRFLLFA